MEKLENYQHKTNLKQIILHIDYTFTYNIDFIIVRITIILNIHSAQRTLMRNQLFCKPF